MPKKSVRVELLKSWSYSKYSCYKTCPFQFKCRYIDKISEGPAPALERGIKIHEECENFLNGVWKDVPDSGMKLEKEFKLIRKKGFIAEQSWGFTKTWEPVPFSSKQAFLRMKIDAHRLIDAGTIKTIDFKTGKERDYQDQLELYSVAAFTVHPLVKEAITEFWYLDHGIITEEVVYDRKDYPKLVKKWENRIKPMFNDTIFAPTPNFLCRNYCSFAKHKSGHCRHG